VRKTYVGVDVDVSFDPVQRPDAALRVVGRPKVP